MARIPSHRAGYCRRREPLTPRMEPSPTANHRPGARPCQIQSAMRLNGSDCSHAAGPVSAARAALPRRTARSPDPADMLDVVGDRRLQRHGQPRSTRKIWPTPDRQDAPCACLAGQSAHRLRALHDETLAANKPTPILRYAIRSTRRGPRTGRRLTNQRAAGFLRSIARILPGYGAANACCLPLPGW